MFRRDRDDGGVPRTLGTESDTLIPDKGHNDKIERGITLNNKRPAVRTESRPHLLDVERTQRSRRHSTGQRASAVGENRIDGHRSVEQAAVAAHDNGLCICNACIIGPDDGESQGIAGLGDVPTGDAPLAAAEKQGGEQENPGDNKDLHHCMSSLRPTGKSWKLSW